MFAILHALGVFICDLLKSRCRLKAENLFLPHQLNITLRQAPHHLPRSPFGLPEVLVAVHTSRLPCRKAGKMRIFTAVRESSGECRIRRENERRCFDMRSFAASPRQRADVFRRPGKETNDGGAPSHGERRRLSPDPYFRPAQAQSNQSSVCCGNRARASITASSICERIELPWRYEPK
jgi:hypothetical protein